MTRTAIKMLKRVGIGACALVAVGILGVWLFIRGSLPTLDGQLNLPGLVEPVRIQRDLLGVPTIAGKSRGDVAYATGFLHAQDRFFQMDLLRRNAAGELAELIGARALETDRNHRIHRFRLLADAALRDLPPDDRALINDYTNGVNSGLATLRHIPFEYGVLRRKPRSWQSADTLLVAWGMYFELQGNLQGRELARGWLKEHSSPEVLRALLPESTQFDAPLDSLPELVTRAVPERGPEWFARSKPVATAVGPGFGAAVGSNGWVIAGNRSTNGSGLLANSMHLSIGLPNTWYRVQLRFPSGDGADNVITGVTLPGVPVVVAGSNTRIAWGFTNSYGDYLDLIELTRDAQNPLRFKTPWGWETATLSEEQINVAHASVERLRVTILDGSPVIEVGDRFYLERWVAGESGAVNLHLRKLETCSTVTDALNVANRSGIPAQNILVADRDGHIGWTIGGAMAGRDGSWETTFPLKEIDNVSRWRGLRPADSHPRIIDPSSGQLWTANNRQLGGEAYRSIGDGGADLGARARQIRDDLTALGSNADEKANFQVELDDRAIYMDRWRRRALALLDDATVSGHPERALFKKLLQESWTGRASPDAVGYRLTRAFYVNAYQEMFSAVDAELKKLDPFAAYSVANPRWPAVVERLLDERPVGWLSGAKTWHELELEALDSTIQQEKKGGNSLENATWALRNTAQIRHPLAGALPIVGSMLSAPADPLPGDNHMPRVASPKFGASERMVVSPGHEQDGIFNMPGGQSGHPLSPYFLAGHDAWVNGLPTPFLPGLTQHVLMLLPRAQDK